ncbi:hypothetical protein [Hyphomicrobium facile]
MTIIDLAQAAGVTERTIRRIEACHSELVR